MVQKYRIVFVCTGNTCRSPMAQGFVTLNYKEIECSSRGTQIRKNTKIAHHCVELLKSKGLDYSQFISTSIQETDFDVDYIFCMTREHVHYCLVRKPVGSKTKVLLLDPSGDIPDPYQGTMQDYERVYSLLENIIPKRVSEIMSL